MPLQTEERFYVELGDRIKTERLKREISQERLAEELGLTRASVVNLEKGRHRASVYQLLVIAEFFILDFPALLPVKSITKQKGKKGKNSIDEQLRNVVSDQEAIDDPTRSVVKEFLTSLKNDK